jgi:predicted RNA polymerase sigma factor
MTGFCFSPVASRVHDVIGSAKLNRLGEARAEFERAASLTRNARERELLFGRAAACAGESAAPQPR